jgi:ankyrin repeat protein
MFLVFKQVKDFISNFCTLRAIEKLLKRSPELLNSQKADGFSGLHLAALNGHNNVIECLLKHKANVEIVTRKMETPLLLAVAKLNVLSVELLVNQSNPFYIKLSKYPLCLGFFFVCRCLCERLGFGWRHSSAFSFQLQIA